jgi:hypothetical protein
MKYLEQKVQTHLEDRLPVILTAVVDKALAPTLTTVLTECLPPTITSVLEGSLAILSPNLDRPVVLHRCSRCGIYWGLRRILALANTLRS